MATENSFDPGKIDIAWCPGCGNFGILRVLKDSLSELQLSPQDVVIVSGIGQAAKLPQYIKAHMFNGLHGRALPPATAIKAVNPRLTVIAASGDGDMYGEGGNHFMHTIRRNPAITNLVHNNMVYGLTKGQASPTSARGFKTPVQVEGTISEPFNPLAVAIALDASFVARVFIGDMAQTKSVLKQAIQHRGYALVDILQPCVTFNKINTFQWFREHTYRLEDSYDPENRAAAFQRAIETEKLPLGIIYRCAQKKTFNENLAVYAEDDTPLWQRPFVRERLAELVQTRR
ncbi:MAG: thiamine pyrophosphate-dependent enzyme [Candidatus Omnitrophica bacterium]|nr:thiamine pyrophosphate-dependent enzyme [Candidatus Omnitrophota bacterium]